MAQGEKRGDPGYDGPPQGAWLLTFSDMVTLLLTFFVLIIAITTIDPKSLVVDGEEEVNLAELQEIYGSGLLGFADPYLMEPVVRLFEDMDSLPQGAVLNQEEIKNAIFQLEPKDPAVNPMQAQADTVRDSVSVFKDERGIVLRWDESVLFPEGGTLLVEANLVLLARLSEFLALTDLPVSVEGFTNPLSPLEGGTGPLSFELAAARSKVVMGYLTRLGLSESRFRLGAYGGTRPLSLDPSRARENARMEIVLYTPPKSSWKG
ncbi:MAG: OmpA family protein [Deltaproteobacteria bacterium]|jgi:chemotaxis protein MotB|nr:OmpA family protein [Deltaproteobacteria bacterium]